MSWCLSTTVDCLISWRVLFLLCQRTLWFMSSQLWDWHIWPLTTVPKSLSVNKVDLNLWFVFWGHMIQMCRRMPSKQFLWCYRCVFVMSFQPSMTSPCSWIGMFSSHGSPWSLYALCTMKPQSKTKNKKKERGKRKTEKEKLDENQQSGSCSLYIYMMRLYYITLSCYVVTITSVQWATQLRHDTASSLFH